MTSGVLCMVACPMLEDELLYGLYSDPEPKRIYLVDTEPAHSIQKKMDDRNISYNIISSNELYSGYVNVDDDAYQVIILMNELGLHAEPKELKAFVEEQIRFLQPFVDVIGLYYGLCGNFGWDISEWCKEMDLKPTFVFRDHTGRVCDDCVGVCVGGGERYLELEKHHTGKFYVTPAIADNWMEFANSSDAAKEVKNLTPDMMEFLGLRGPEDYQRWLFSIGGYSAILQLDSGLETDRTHFDDKVKEISKVVELKIEESEPIWPTLQPTIDLYNNCKKALRP